MGYSIYFSDEFSIYPPVRIEHRNLLHQVSNSGVDGYSPPTDYGTDWELTKSSSGLHHNGIEKSRDNIEWLQYLLKHFFGPLGYVVQGKVFWSGEDPSDSGLIWIKDSELKSIYIKDMAEKFDWEDV